jgi:hypothetical protein
VLGLPLDVLVVPAFGLQEGATHNGANIHVMTLDYDGSSSSLGVKSIVDITG